MIMYRKGMYSSFALDKAFCFFITLIADEPHPILPVVTITKDLSISPRVTLYEFLSRCQFITLQLVN